jgi:cytochrome c553
MSHDPHAPENAPQSQDHEDSLSRSLANTQFVITGIFILVIASLAYVAGTHSAKGDTRRRGADRRPPPAKVDVQALIKTTPDLIAKGKSLFAVNCASCHGTTGQGTARRRSP